MWLNAGTRFTRIAIVEDNRDLRESLQKMVEAAPGLQFACSFSNAEDAIRNLPKHTPDVVLMDIHLPFRSGIECIRILKDLCPDIRVLILTVYEDSDSIFDALKAGASGVRSRTEILLRFRAANPDS